RSRKEADVQKKQERNLTGVQTDVEVVHYEVVQYLMDCCGITYSQAVQALRSNDWDLWQAEAAICSNKM
ncbi:hypothetical protein C9146_19405, partial [Escherichia coli]